MDSLDWKSYIDAQVVTEPGVAPATKQGAEESSEPFEFDATYPHFLSAGDDAFSPVGEFPSHYFNFFGYGTAPFLSDAPSMIPVDDVSCDTSNDMLQFVDYSSEDSTDSVASPLPASSQDSASPACLSQSSPSPSMSPLPDPAWDYSDLSLHIAGDTQLVAAFNLIMDKVSQFEMPTKDDFLQFVATKRGRFFCAVEGCPWYEKGWKREDRGTAHVKKEHFKLLCYKCVDCNLVYKWPHDLAKHRRLKHPQQGETPPPKYTCPEHNCHASFTKTSNLTRHRRKVHKKSAAARRNVRKCL